MSITPMDNTEEALRLLSAQTDGTLDEAGQQRLCQLLAQDAAARQVCREYSALTAALRRQARREQAEEAEGWRLEAVGQEVAGTPTRSVSEESTSSPDQCTILLVRDARETSARQDFYEAVSLHCDSLLEASRQGKETGRLRGTADLETPPVCSREAVRTGRAAPA